MQAVGCHWLELMGISSVGAIGVDGSGINGVVEAINLVL